MPIEPQPAAPDAAGSTALHARRLLQWPVVREQQSATPMGWRQVRLTPVPMERRGQVYLVRSLLAELPLARVGSTERGAVELLANPVAQFRSRRFGECDGRETLHLQSAGCNQRPLYRELPEGRPNTEHDDADLRPGAAEPDDDEEAEA